MTNPREYDIASDAVWRCDVVAKNTSVPKAAKKAEAKTTKEEVRAALTKCATCGQAGHSCPMQNQPTVLGKLLK